MRVLTKLMLTIVALMEVCTVVAQKEITIKGKVQFPDNRFKMQIIQQDGFNRIIIDSTIVKSDGTYEFRMPMKLPGTYYLDCQKWQGVSFWAEDEDLEINFRGMDTARIKIKNPPYVYIKGGPKNEVMNLMNWDAYRNYQLMIGVSQNVYKISGMDDQAKQKLSGNFYSMLGDEYIARMRYLAEYYSDRNSVLAILPALSNDETFVKDIIARLEKKEPNYAPLVKFKQEYKEKLAQKARLAEGNKAPQFSYFTADGKKKLGPQNFKGKILVLDFWASWCGPCRQEIPNLKKAYSTYHTKGVEFLSVSIDKDAQAWKKAMKEENMPWHQVLAPNAGTEVMKLYQFSGIPYILILDKDGKIVGKNYRGKNLTDKLDELLSGKKRTIIAMPAATM